MSAATASYWCYRCTRFVAVSASGGGQATCPHCETGFVEEIETTPSSHPDDLHRRFTYMISSAGAGEGTPGRHGGRLGRFRRRRSSRSMTDDDAGPTAPFNPVIVLRGPTAEAGENEESGGGFRFFYDDGNGAGLRPVPAGVSEFLMGWGFDRLLEQLTQVEGLAGGRGLRPVAAAKAAVEAMPTVGITERHVAEEDHCAVCKEAFEAGGEAREMPCRHIFHSDCILPWLAERNSCPVCRHEVEPEEEDSLAPESATGGDEDVVGLTIWRLPGGGFAVGRFNGGGRGRLGFPLSTEAEGQDGNSATSTPRRVSWRRRVRRVRISNDGDVGGYREGGQDRNFGIWGHFRGLFSFLRRPASSRSTPGSDSEGSTTRATRNRIPVFSGHRGAGW